MGSGEQEMVEQRAWNKKEEGESQKNHVSMAQRNPAGGWGLPLKEDGAKGIEDAAVARFGGVNILGR